MSPDTFRAELAKLLRVVRASEPACAGATRHVAEMAGRLGVRPPRARVVAGLGSPLIAGLVRPVLLWPKELQHALADDGMKAVLIHELAHLRRRDHFIAANNLLRLSLASPNSIMHFEL